MVRRAAASIRAIAVLALVLWPAMGRAQVNIDRGKTAAEIYSSDCATCHKTIRGLAVGKNSLMLSSFLREHYTASRDQAAALAAYVLSSGGAEAPPKQKPEVARARAEEPKLGGPKPDEPKLAEPKNGARPVRAASAKPEEPTAPKEQNARHEENPGLADVHARDVHPEIANRGEKRTPEAAAPVPHGPAPVAAAPAAVETPRAAEAPAAAAIATPGAVASAEPGSITGGVSSHLPSLELGSTLTAVAPPEEQPNAAAAVPRDNIPD